MVCIRVEEVEEEEEVEEVEEADRPYLRPLLIAGSLPEVVEHVPVVGVFLAALGDL